MVSNTHCLDLLAFVSCHLWVRNPNVTVSVSSSNAKSVEIAIANSSREVLCVVMLKGPAVLSTVEAGIKMTPPPYKSRSSIIATHRG